MRKYLVLALMLLYPVIQKAEAKYLCCPVQDRCIKKDKCATKVKCEPACGKKATCQKGFDLKNKYWIVK